MIVITHWSMLLTRTGLPILIFVCEVKDVLVAVLLCGLSPLQASSVLSCSDAGKCPSLFGNTKTSSNDPSLLLNTPLYDTSIRVSVSLGERLKRS